MCKEWSRESHWPQLHFKCLQLTPVHCPIYNPPISIYIYPPFTQTHCVTITMTDSPGSTLSSIASDDMSDHEDLKPEHNQAPSPSASSIMPPSKRRRTNVGALDHATPGSSHQEDNPPMSPSSSISSDTSGDIPNSPSIQALLGSGQDDEYSGHGGDQVTVCRWAGCETDDLGNLDALVQHIHEQHIATREKKFVCEWAGCPRNGQPHASGYALRAHMRSHTREKPFYCSLPGLSIHPFSF